MDGLGATLRTTTLHGERRVFEAELGEELSRTLAPGTENPRDLHIGSQCVEYECPTYAPTPMAGCDDEHGEIPI
jgi:hypothetical protein